MEMVHHWLQLSEPREPVWLHVDPGVLTVSEAVLFHRKGGI